MTERTIDPGVHDSGASLELDHVVRSVRRRWRLRRVLRGLSIAIAGSVMSLGIASAAMGAFFYSDPAVNTARLAVTLVIGVLLAAFVVRPLLPTPRDEDVALFVEEREPSLEGSLLTAVETRRPGGAHASPALIARLMSSTRSRLRAVGDGARADQEALRTSWMLMGFVVLATILATVVAPVSLRQGVGLLLRPWSPVPPAVRMSIAVEPGDTELPRGGDLLVRATLRGFDGDRADVLMRTADSLPWVPVPMAREEDGRFAARLFDLTAGTEYVVESSGVRSAVYRIVVSDLPATRSLDLEYRYPSYTGLAPQRVDSTGDIAAIRGTQVRVTVHTTMASPGGRLVLDDGRAIPLARQSDSITRVCDRRAA
jgi:hypothetical protein